MRALVDALYLLTAPSVRWTMWLERMQAVVREREAAAKAAEDGQREASAQVCWMAVTTQKHSG